MTDEDARIGSLVDERYKIIEAMASGSMGAVYKAERVPVGKLVAVKFLKALYANDSEFLGRFERETRVMSKLAHPNCVSVVDFGVSEGAPYLVMEYVQGTTLRSLCDAGRVAPPRALGIARQIAAGLAHAHAQGIVHRDVKPANVMISEEIGTGEHVRILDFGLARLRGNVGRDATQTNMVVGTPNYMAPEQTVPGGLIDARTDVYAVGVVLYEMIAGKRPFQAEDTMTLLGMHRAAPIPRLADNLPNDIELPDGVQDVIDRAMAKVPAERFQTAVELAEAIDELGAVPRPMTPTGSSRVMIPRRARSEPGIRAGGKHTTTAVAPTVQMDVPSIADQLDDSHHAPPAGRMRFALGSVLLLGGIAAGAGYLIRRGEQESSNMKSHVASGSAPSPGSATKSMSPGSGEHWSPDEPGSNDTDPVEPGSAALPPPPVDAAAAPPDAPAIDASAPIDAATVTPGSGAGSDEIEMDPDKAVDPDPTGTGSGSAKEEAADAPPNRDEVEARLPKPAQPAQTINEAVQLIKDGKRELALSSLRTLGAKTPKSAYIPFLMGNLYYDKLWWAVAMDEYRIAIARNTAYKSNATLNKNVIEMLGSSKTVGKAVYFLRFTIGHPALYYLRNAAAHDDNPTIRRNAGMLVHQIR